MKKMKSLETLYRYEAHVMHYLSKIPKINPQYGYYKSQLHNVRMEITEWEQRKYEREEQEEEKKEVVRTGCAELIRECYDDIVEGTITLADFARAHGFPYGTVSKQFQREKLKRNKLEVYESVQ